MFELGSELWIFIISALCHRTQN